MIENQMRNEVFVSDIVFVKYNYVIFSFQIIFLNDTTKVRDKPTNCLILLLLYFKYRCVGVERGSKQFKKKIFKIFYKSKRSPEEVSARPFPPSFQKRKILTKLTRLLGILSKPPSISKLYSSNADQCNLYSFDKICFLPFTSF